MLVFASCGFAAVGPGVSAQERSMVITDSEAVFGGTVSVFIEARTDQPIRGFQALVDFPEDVLEFEQMVRHDTVFASRGIELFESSSESGELVVRATIDDDSASVPAGDNLRLARLDFKMALDFNLDGTEFEIELLGGVGTTETLFVGEDGDFPPESVDSGTVTIVRENFIRVRNTDGVGAGRQATIEISGFNVEPLQGFSLALRVDPARIRILGVQIEGTLTEAVGAEYVAPVIDNVRGELNTGILLDAEPPYESQLIPVAGFDVPLANVDVEVLSTGGDLGTDILFVDRTGEPPVRNRFVIDNQSVGLRTQNGRLTFLMERPFLRGDINEDEVVDMSDSIAGLIWVILTGEGPDCEKLGDVNDDGVVNTPDLIQLLHYLFRGAEPPAPPFPEIGLDPTADDLPCPL